MIDQPELRLPRPGQPDLIVDVYVLREENVARYRRDSNSVGRHHAPALAAQNLELIPAQVHPEQAQSEDIAIRAYVEIRYRRCGAAQEVRFPVADYVRALHVGVDPCANSRVLKAEPILGKVSRYRVAEWDAPKIAADSGTGVRASKHAREVNEPDRHYRRRADMYLQRRLFGLGLSALCYGSPGCASRWLRRPG